MSASERRRLTATVAAAIARAVRGAAPQIPINGRPPAARTGPGAQKGGDSAGPAKGTASDIDSEKLLRLPNIVDPRSSPRYIDKIFESVAFKGPFIFAWQEGGKEQHVGVPLVDLEENDTLDFSPFMEVHNSKEEALWNVRSYPTNKFKIYTFYRTEHNVIMPTTFCIQSTPEFHRLLPGLKKDMVRSRATIRRALVPFANMVNPIPGTTVDEYGNMGLSGNPADWLALFSRLRRARIEEAGPRTRRFHSGYNVAYRVLGPHENLSGTSVYVLKDADGTVLYVGKGDAIARLREHIKDPKKTQWFGEIDRLEVWATGLNNTQALALEESLIAQLEPLHNVDQKPFQKEFGDALAVGPNLPRAQRIMTFSLEWGH
jgi:hypothetical protein